MRDVQVALGLLRFRRDGVFAQDVLAGPPDQLPQFQHCGLRLGRQREGFGQHHRVVERQRRGRGCGQVLPHGCHQPVQLVVAHLVGEADFLQQDVQPFQRDQVESGQVAQRVLVLVHQGAQAWLVGERQQPRVAGAPGVPSGTPARVVADLGGVWNVGHAHMVPCRLGS